MTIETKAWELIRMPNRTAAAPLGIPNKQKGKSALAREARERGEPTFMATCTRHGETPHYSSNAKCIACKAKNSREAYENVIKSRRSEPEARKRQREYQRSLRATSAKVRGATREDSAARAWRNAFLPEGSMGNMTGWYSLERDAICRLYADLRGGFEMDHAIPKLAKDAGGKRTACGLHCWANLVETPSDVNKLKRTQFDPDRNRLQRPANRHPGGAFDPEPTEYEWSLIRQNEEMGTPEPESLRALRGDLDAKARRQEQHVAAVLARITGEASA